MQDHKAWMDWLVRRGILTPAQAEDTLRRILAGEDVRIPIAKGRRVGDKVKVRVPGDGKALGLMALKEEKE